MAFDGICWSVDLIIGPCDLWQESGEDHAKYQLLLQRLQILMHISFNNELGLMSTKGLSSN